MRIFAIGFAFGAICLQNAATLPAKDALWGLPGLILGALICFGAGLYLSHGSPRWRVWRDSFGERGVGGSAAECEGGSEGTTRRGLHHKGLFDVREYGRRCLIFGLPGLCCLSGAGLLGFDWAAWRAYERLASSLPLEWEDKDIRLSGRVAGLPAIKGDTSLFVMEVDELHRPRPILPEPWSDADFARRIRLSWTKAPALKPGQRWELTVRLRRPHANANFRGADFEAWMLQRGIRATGQVRARENATLLPPDTIDEADIGAGSQPIRRHVLDAWWMNVRMGIDTIRHGIGERIRRVLRQPSGSSAHQHPHVGIVRALAIGDQSDISSEDWTRFTRTGTNHLVAISGLHVALAAGIAATIFGGLWRLMSRMGLGLVLWIPAQYVGRGAAVAGAAFFVGLAGFGIPAQRAFWMLATIFLANWHGRLPAASYVLCGALLAVVCVDPWAVTSAGFWLSFGAVGSILFALAARAREVEPHESEREDQTRVAALNSLGDKGSLLRRLIRNKPRMNGSVQRRPAGALRRSWQRIWQHVWPSWRRALTAMSQVQWAVTIALVPASALFFSQVSLSGPLANAFAIPWVSFLVVPVVLAGIMLPAPFDAWALILAHELIACLSYVLNVLASPTWAVWRLPAPNGLSFAAALLGLACWLGPKGLPLRPLTPFLCLPLFLYRPASPAAGDFRVTMLDIGQGNAVLVETHGHRMLYDTGPVEAGTRVILPFFQAHGIRRLDSLVVSHNHNDHYGGASALLEQIPVSTFLASLPLDQRLWQQARAGTLEVRKKSPSALGARTELTRCMAGQGWEWDDVRFDVLWPQDPEAGKAPNDMSCVIRVSNDFHAVLLAGDAEAFAEAGLLAGGRALAAAVLLAPHHGSKSSSSAPFVQAVRPAHVVFQVGYRNRYRHPHEPVVARYAARGTHMYRNDQDGAVRFDARGKTLQIVAVRRAYRRYWMGA